MEDKSKELESIIAGFFERPRKCTYGRKDDREFRISENKGVDVGWADVIWREAKVSASPGGGVDGVCGQSPDMGAF